MACIETWVCLIHGIPHTVVIPDFGGAMVGKCPLCEMKEIETLKSNCFSETLEKLNLLSSHTIK